MKKFLLFLLTLKSVFAVEQFDIYEAFEKAQRLNKPVYYVVASSRCSHCINYLQNTIYPNFKQINRDFVFALTDIAKGEKIPSNIPFSGTTPTTYIIAPNGSLMVSPIKGNFSSEYLHKILNKLYKAYARN